MRRLLLILLLFCFGIAFGQTFTGDVTLTTQAQVNSFGTSNYTIIDGRVIIGSSTDINDLSPLSTWLQITGGLIISENSALTNLNGLNSLTDLGNYDNDYLMSLVIRNNPILSDITSLENLTIIFGLFIEGNNSLSTLEGLHNISEAQSYFSISQNASLVDLNGLRGLTGSTSFEIFNIHANNNLISLNGLQNFNAVVNDLLIADNLELRGLSPLSGFSIIIEATGSTITNNTKLSSFCGAYGLSSEPMTINGNAQNPTQQDIIDAGPCVYTDILGDNFEAYLITNGIDTEQIVDNKVLTSDISGILTLDVSTQGIIDLTGIEDFTALQTLIASFNSISTIDVAQNSNLEVLELLDNNINTIDVSSNTLLTRLRLGLNNLSSIDLLSNGALEFLFLAGNSISSIDLSSNTLLKEVYLGNNSLTTLDLSSNNALVNIVVLDNSLTDLDLSNKPDLFLIIASNNNLSAIDLDNTPMLDTALLDNNNLTSLDVSLNSSLGTLRINNNNLTRLNAKNNSLLNLSADQNPNLNCIEVIDVAQAEQRVIDGDWNVDVKPNLFSTDCAARYTLIPDPNFEQALIDLNYDSEGTLDGRVLTSDISGRTALDVNTKAINDLTGIEAFVSLLSLDTSFNNLTSVNVSNATSLNTLELGDNAITSLDLSINTSLVRLGADSNTIASIDLSFNTQLEELSLYGNSLSTLVLTNNSLLKRLILTGNNLSAIDLSTNVAIEFLTISRNPLTSIDLESNVLLEELYINETQILELDLRLNILMTYLEATDGILTMLDIRNGPAAVFDFLSVVNNNQTCIAVDNVNGAQNRTDQGKWFKDTDAVYVLDCSTIVSVEFSNATGTDFESSGGNLPSLFVTGAIVNATTVTISGLTTGSATINEDYTFVGPANLVLNIPPGTYDGTSGTAIDIPFSAFSIVDDATYEGNENINLEIGDVSGDINTIGANNSFEYIIIDDDYTANISASDNTATETGPTPGEFTVSLNAPNTSGSPISVSYLISGSAQEGADYLLPTDIVTISNGQISNIITINPINDGTAELLENVILTLTIGTQYVVGPNANATVNIVDSSVPGTAGFAISGENGSTVTSETGTTDSFELTLNTAPLNNVVLNVSSNDTGEGTVDLASITFSSTNWNVPQSITVTGQDDVLVDGPQNYTITVSVDDANSDDAFDSLADQTINAINQDDDAAGTPGVILSKNTVSTSEPNSSDSFTVVLNSAPTSDVVLQVNSDTPTEAINSPTSITFTSANWNVPQTVIVTGVNDIFEDGSQTYNIIISIVDSGSADEYDDIPDQIITGTNQDDEGNPGPVLSLTDIKVTVQNGTCPSVQNGIINIETLANYNFNVSIVGEDLPNGITGTVSLNNPNTFPNLARGSYEVCLTTTEFPNWNQCFGINITNYDDLAVFATEIDPIGKTANFRVGGSKNYTVNSNGKTYFFEFENTQLNTIEIPLDTKINKITITGESDCQGIYEEQIVLHQVIAFPNPVITELQILGSALEGDAKVSVSNSSGKIVKTEQLFIKNGRFTIDCSKLSNGMYFIRLKTSQKEMDFKIIKQ